MLFINRLIYKHPSLTDMNNINMYLIFVFVKLEIYLLRSKWMNHIKN